MSIIEYLSVDFIGNVAKFVKDLLVCIFLFRKGLRQKRQILTYTDLSCVEKFLHDAHKLHKLFGDDFQSGCPSSSRKHLGTAVDELSYLLDCIECQTEVKLLHKYIEDKIFIDTENAQQIGLKGERALYFESFPCIKCILR